MYNGIIIAAGMGQRLSPLTDDRPKTTLPVFGKPIIDHVIDTFDEFNINQKAIITGYCADKLSHYKADFFHNDEFRTNNILHSLMKAKDFLQKSYELGKGVVISYSDIYFKPNVLDELLKTPSSNKVTIVLDHEWEKLYFNRDDNPINQGEMAEHDGEKIVAIGKGIPAKEELKRTEFIGLLKLSAEGIKIWLDVFHDLNQKLDTEEPFQRAKHWRQSYLTDFLQELVNRGHRVDFAKINNDWLEFDTLGDYERVQQYETLDKFQLLY
jgi:choline kinase